MTNVPGAGGTIGIVQFVNGAKGDGSQLMVNGYVMVGAILTNKAPIGLDQTTPIARLTAEYEAIVVPANSPIKTAKDLAAALKADPAKVTWAGGSAGGVDHIAAALFAKAAGADPTKINYIPFSGGGEALAAILGGKVTAGISGYGEFESQIKAGKLRLIGVTSPNRLPNVNGPTLKEQGVDLEIANWRSVVAPPGITRRAEEGPHRDRRQAREVEGMAGNPEGQGLGRRLSLGRRLREIPDRGDRAHQGGAYLRRPREVLSRRGTAVTGSAAFGRRFLFGWTAPAADCMVPQASPLKKGFPP